jgi:hypothetical protein
MIHLWYSTFCFLILLTQVLLILKVSAAILSLRVSKNCNTCSFSLRGSSLWFHGILAVAKVIFWTNTVLLFVMVCCRLPTELNLQMKCLFPFPTLLQWGWEAGVRWVDDYYCHKTWIRKAVNSIKGGEVPQQITAYVLVETWLLTDYPSAKEIL